MSESTARVTEGNLYSYMKLFTKIEPLAEANSTAFTDTNFMVF